MSVHDALPHDAALRHVTGAARFFDDTPAPAGALHLAFGDIRAVAIALVFGVMIAAFILLFGPEVLFGMVFGVMGPAMVNWVVLPLIRGQALFGGGASGAIARTALIGAMFGLGLAVLLSLLEKIGARRA